MLLRFAARLALALAALLALAGCGDDDGPARSDAGPDVLAPPADGGADADDDAAADAGLDAGADAGDAEPAACPSTPTADRGVLCGLVTRDDSLPTDGSPARDGRGDLYVFAWDCDPFVHEGLASCGARQPRIVSEAYFHDVDADLSGRGASIPYELRGIPEGTLYVAAVMLDAPHDLSDGLLPGDWASRPAVFADVAAGEAQVLDVELDTLVRGVRARVTRSPLVVPALDGVGALAVVGYTHEPAPGDAAELGAVYGCADFSGADGEAIVLVSTFDAAPHWLLPFLDDDGNGLASGPTAGDLLGLPATRVDIGARDVVVDAELTLTMVLDRGAVDAGPPGDGGPDAGAPGCGDAGP